MKQDEASTVIYFPTSIRTIKCVAGWFWPHCRDSGVSGFNLCWGSCQLQQSHQWDHPNESDKSEQPEQSDEWPWSDSNLTHRSSLALFVEPWHDLMTWYTNEANYKASCPTLVKLHGACVGCLRHAKHGAERARNLLFWSILSSWVAFSASVRIMTSQWMTRPCQRTRWCGLFAQMSVKSWRLGWRWLLYELTIEFVGYCGHFPYIYIIYNIYIYIYHTHTYIYILYRVCVNMMKRCKKVRIGIRKSALLCSSWRVAVPGTSDPRTFQ